MIENPDAFANLVYLILLLAALTWFYGRNRGRRGGALRQAMIWALIFCSVALGYVLIGQLFAP